MLGGDKYEIADEFCDKTKVGVEMRFADARTEVGVEILCTNRIMVLGPSPDIQTQFNKHEVSRDIRLINLYQNNHILPNIDRLS
jgi:hypothetical protein